MAVNSKRTKTRQRRTYSLELLEARLAMSATPLISEFMASNSTALADGDGNHPDWIEIYNPTSQAINLAGWRLTDDAANLSRWSFPALTQSVLDPGEHLVVFASGQLTSNYIDAGGNLHTNFSLSSTGEYLALVNPSGQVIHEYAPEYPLQRNDVSYGVVENLTTLNLVGPTSATKALVPTTNALDSTSTAVAPAWTLPGFNDAAWLAASGPAVGFDNDNTPPSSPPNGKLRPEGLVGNDFTDPGETGVLNGTIFAGGFPGSPGGEEPPKGLDNTATTKWLAFTPAGTYYGFRFANAQRYAVSAYTITSANDAPERDPYSWTLSGSNDGTNYTVIDTRNAQDFAGRFETRMYQFGNTTAYEYYKFDLQTEFGVTGANQPVAIQVAEFELLSSAPIDFTPLVNLNIATPYTAAKTSVYQRTAFNVTNPASLTSLRLDMQYDDGFVAYLNGVRVASASAPTLPNFNSNATLERIDKDAIVPKSFNLTPFLGNLVAGQNVLSIHALNVSDANLDLLSIPKLIATELVDNTLQTMYMPTPTPGLTNVPGVAGLAASPVLSVAAGIYDAAFPLSITSATPGASIYYTTNGSAPTAQNGTLYTGPINVAATSTIRARAYFAGYLESAPITGSYIFLNDVLRQSNASAQARGLPSTWGPYSVDYGMDPDVIGNFNASGVSTGGDLYGGIYAATIKNDLKSFPTMSLVLNADDMFGANGIYTNGTASGDAWERAVSVEYFDPNSPTKRFNIDAGLRLHGGAFRSDGLSKKHSMRLVFRGEYEGNNKLDYPLFGDSAANSFDTLVLRMDSNDGYAWDAAGANAQYARNEFGNRTQAALGQPAPHSTRVHLYINGVYWGIYNPVERPDNDFAASYFGGVSDNWDSINSGAINAGTMDSWNTLVSLSNAVTSASTEAARTAAYMKVLGLNANGTDNPAFEAYLDATNYADYLLTNFFMGNNDWPHRNWWTARERGAASEGFKFMMWDSETSLGLGSDVNTNRTGANVGAAEPYNALKSSLEFRTLFGDRVHRAMFNNGPLSTANNVARYTAITNELTSAIVAESARWGDMHSGTPYTKANWQSARTSVINLLNSRNNIFLNQLRTAGLYSTVTAPTFSQFGGQVAANYALTMTAPAGTIYYTLDGSDPRQIGGAVSGAAVQYTGAVNLPTDRVVKARVLSGTTWSALTDATFTTAAPATASNLRISEIHYNPGPRAGVADSQNLEFIELVNPSSGRVSLDNVQLTQFATTPYAFPAGLRLEPGQRIIVAKDPATFTSVYGAGINVAPDGYGDFNLANGGEGVGLLGGAGQTIQSFTYDDVAPWPTTPDGGGKSLEIIDPFGDPAAPANWRASFYNGGSPGWDGLAPALAGDFDRNGVVNTADRTFWANRFGGTIGLGLQADANLNGEVDAGDFTVWRDSLPAPATIAFATAATSAPSGLWTLPVTGSASPVVSDLIETSAARTLPIDQALAELTWRHPHRSAADGSEEAGPQRRNRPVAKRTAEPLSRLWSIKSSLG